MTEPLISVILLSYHSRKKEFFATLNSIIAQKDCSYELIIADDGSPDFFQSEIEAFLDSRRILNYQILCAEKNRGTVCNLLRAVQAAKGKYIKPISPADYLYDAYTLRDLGAFMEKKQAKAAFGSMVFYHNEGIFQTFRIRFPFRHQIYQADRNRYSFRRALKMQFVLGDTLCGAAAIYDRELFRQSLEMLTPSVVYAEDLVFQLLAAQNIRIYHMDRKILWYEYGSGISTQTPSNTFSRLDTDFYEFYQLIHRQYPQILYLKRVLRVWEIKKHGSRLLKFTTKLFPDKILFSLYRRFLLRTINPHGYDDQFFRECLHAVPAELTERKIPADAGMDT